jgi:choline dehydrogenase
MEAWDYIVVGAGAAGSVVAGRLAAESDATVLLVEAGGSDRSPMLHVPKGFYRTLRGDRYLYRYPVRTPGPGGRHETWLRGRVLGGSAAVNGMTWARGAPADWDGLAARGNPGWGWADIAPAAAGLEERLGVSVAPATGPVSRAIIESAVAYGWEHVADFNAHDSERIASCPVTIRHGRRVTSYRAFAGPGEVRRRRNLSVAARTRAGYLLFDGNRVTGVRVRRRGVTADLTARREVIVCAGAVETPLLLERSGIGDPDVLGPLGITARVPSPRVGTRVTEQRAVTLQVALRRDAVRESAGLARLGSLAGKARESLLYIRSHTGPLATAGYDLACQFKSAPHLARPDIHALLAPLAIDPSSRDMRLARHAGILFTGYAIRPGPSASIHVSGPGPDDLPVIEARCLTAQRDRAATAPVLGIARGLLGTGPVAGLIGAEDFPGPSVATPEAALRHAEDAGAGIYHAVGSAAMGPGEDDVTDAALRVRGAAGLRVADASVLPAQVSGGTAAPAMLVGWRAADLILASAR